MRWIKFFGIVIALGIFTATIAVLPVTGADPQTVFSYVYDADDGSGTWARYNNLSGVEGWTVYWTDHTDRGVYRGNPADSTIYDHAGAPNNLTYGAWVMDNLYPDPGGWWYNSQCTIIMENATGYAAWTYTSDTGSTSPYFMPNVRLKKIPDPTCVPNGPSVDLTWDPFEMEDDLGNPLPEVTSQLEGYLVYRATTAWGAPSPTWNDNPAMGPVEGSPSDWQLIGGTVESPITVTWWTDTTAIPLNYYHYSIKFVLSGFDSGGSPANVSSMYGGLGVPGGFPPPPWPPETWITGIDPDPHDGNIINDYVTITATVDDTIADAMPDVVIAAEYRVTDPYSVVWGPYPMTMTSGGGTPTESFAADWYFPNGAPEGTYIVEVHGCDVESGWNASWVSDTFDIIDATAPLVEYLPATPVDGALRSIGTPVQIWASYEDFTPYSSATLYWWNATEGFWANSAPMNNNSFWWGSYGNDFEQSFTVYCVETIWYEVVCEDSSAGGPLWSSSGQRRLNYHYDSEATGPIGSSGSLGPFTITYDSGCGCHGTTRLYYSDDNNNTWNYIDHDPDEDGNYTWTAPGLGTYWWIADGDSWDGGDPPMSGDPAEAGPYIIVDPPVFIWANKSGNDVRLEWSDGLGGPYEIYISNNITGSGFDFAAPNATTSDDYWNHANVLGDGNNYSYIVRRLGNIVNSNIGWKLAFQIQQPGNPNINWVSVPYVWEHTTLGDVGPDVGDAISWEIRAWSAVAQDWKVIAYNPLFGWTGDTTYALQPGDAFLVFCSQAPGVWDICGAHDSSLALNIQQPGNPNINWASMPFHHSFATLGAVGPDVGDAISWEIRAWSVAAQDWKVIAYNPLFGWTGDTAYALVPGDAVLIFCSQAPGAWQPTTNAIGP